jgi:hypothetical protein
MNGMLSSAGQRETRYVEMNVALGVDALEQANKVGYAYKPLISERLLLDVLRLDVLIRTQGSAISENERLRAGDWIRRSMLLLEQTGYPFDKIPFGELVMLNDPYLGETLNKAAAVERLRRDAD